MTTPIVRAFASDLEVRAGGDGRTIAGIAVPFDQPADVSDLIRGRIVSYTEIFRRGAFAKTLAERGERVKFLVKHNRDRSSLPLGRAIALREDAVGLVGEFRVSKTSFGDEVLELVRDGALDGLSIGYKPIRPDFDAPRPGAVVERLEVRLDEVSVVDFPAYEGALITAIRSTSEAPDQAAEDAAAPSSDAADPGTSLVIPRSELRQFLLAEHELLKEQTS